jgi:hypothetical protein
MASDNESEEIRPNNEVSASKTESTPSNPDSPPRRHSKRIQLQQEPEPPKTPQQRQSNRNLQLPTTQSSRKKGPIPSFLPGQVFGPKARKMPQAQKQKPAQKSAQKSARKSTSGKTVAPKAKEKTRRWKAGSTSGYYNYYYKTLLTENSCCSS